MARFCIKCGKLEDENNPLIDNLCSKCFLEERKLVNVPEVIRVAICKRCLAYNAKGKWIRPASRDFLEVLQEAVTMELFNKIETKMHGVKVSFEPLIPQYREAYIKVNASLLLNHVELKQQYTVKIEVDQVYCPRCLRVVTGRHRATIQIRGDQGLTRKAFTKVYGFLREAANKMGNIEENIVEVEGVRGGIDIKVSDFSTARRIAEYLRSKLGAHVKESFKGISQDREGRRRAELTVSIRLPAILPGDIVVMEDELVKILSIEGEHVVLERIRDGGRGTVKTIALWDGTLKKVPDNAEKKTLIISTIDDDVACLVDPVTGQVFYIEADKIPYDLREGDAITTLIIDGKPYVLNTGNITII